jgi:hypothetical protein
MEMQAHSRTRHRILFVSIDFRRAEPGKRFWCFAAWPIVQTCGAAHCVPGQRHSEGGSADGEEPQFKLGTTLVSSSCS